MIQGQVNKNREAVVPLVVLGPVSGTQVEINAVLDTGFDDYLTLPLEMIASLALVTIGLSPVQMADGNLSQTILFKAEAVRHGIRIPISVQMAPGSPLLGMAMLKGSRLTISVREEGAV